MADNVFDRVDTILSETRVVSVGDRRDGEFTAPEYARSRDVSNTTARQRLMVLVNSKRLVRRPGKENGRPIFFFSFSSTVR